MPALVNLIGLKFGRLMVISRGVNNRWGASTWNCDCSCGAKIIAVSGNLLRGKTLSCGCLRAEVRKNQKHNRKTNPQDTSINKEYAACRSGARQRKYDFDLSKEEFVNLIFKNCFYCGCSPNRKFSPYIKTNGDMSQRAIDLDKNIVDGYFRDTLISINGIDRVDNTRGYTEGNVVACCTTCNRAKLQMSVEEFLNWVMQIAEFQKSKI